MELKKGFGSLPLSAKAVFIFLVFSVYYGLKLAMTNYAAGYNFLFGISIAPGILAILPNAIIFCIIPLFLLRCMLDRNNSTAKYLTLYFGIFAVLCLVFFVLPLDEMKKYPGIRNVVIPIVFVFYLIIIFLVYKTKRYFEQKNNDIN